MHFAPAALPPTEPRAKERFSSGGGTGSLLSRLQGMMAGRSARPTTAPMPTETVTTNEPTPEASEPPAPVDQADVATAAATKAGWSEAPQFLTTQDAAKLAMELSGWSEAPKPNMGTGRVGVLARAFGLADKLGRGDADEGLQSPGSPVAPNTPAARETEETEEEKQRRQEAEQEEQRAREQDAAALKDLLAWVPPNSVITGRPRRALRAAAGAVSGVGSAVQAFVEAKAAKRAAAQGRGDARLAAQVAHLEERITDEVRESEI